MRKINCLLIALVGMMLLGCSSRYERFCYDGVQWVVCPDYAKPGDTIQPIKKAKKVSKKKIT